MKCEKKNRTIADLPGATIEEGRQFTERFLVACPVVRTVL